MCVYDKFKYREEKDELELKCIMLKKDSKMYRDRMEDILKQLEEVIKERDKVSHFPLHDKAYSNLMW